MGAQATSRKQTPRPAPGLALPSVNEHTPLLIPGRSLRSLSPGRDAALSPNNAILLPGSMGKVRLLKRTSTGDFGAALGIGSQAGLLLMAASPPAGGGSGHSGLSSGPSSLRRGTSSTRAGQPSAWPRSAEGRQSGDERRSTESQRPADVDRV